MDALSPEEVQTRIDAEKEESTEDPPVSPFELSYNTRYQKGDVIEVGEDNRWHDGQHGNGKFLICRVPFLPLWQAKAYMEQLEGVFRRRYRMWFENIDEETMRAHQVAPYVYELSTIDELLLFGQDKLDEL